MKRPQEHITEEESRKQFALLIPDGWVSHDFTKDYGKDIYLEIFKDFKATGNTFVCQLKGSTQDINNNQTSVNIKVETLKYFGTLPYPVLLVFYSTQTKQFWAIWAMALLYAYPGKENQQTIKIILNEHHLINKDFFLSMEKLFDPHISVKLNLIFKGNSRNLSVYRIKILKWLNKYYNSYFEEENYLLPMYVEINVDDENGQDIVTLKTPVITYQLSPVANDELQELYKPVLKEDMISALEAEILYLFSSIFASHDLKASLTMLSFVLPRYNGKFKNNQSLIAIGRLALTQKHITEYQRLIQVIIDHGSLDDFKILNMALFVYDRPKTLIILYRENLVRAINKFTDEKNKADLYYNLANHYRHIKDYQLASYNFQQARKLNPDYLNRYYWWHEYAGVLYQSGHFKIASSFYQRSIEMDVERRYLPLTYALKADCLFKRYQFTEAATLIDQYLEDVATLGKLPSVYYALLHTICRSFEKFGFNQIEADVILSLDYEKQGLASGDLTLFQKAVNTNPLNAPAWFNIGVLFNKENNFDEAFMVFLTAALILYDDKESWLNCFWLQQKHGEPEMAMSILTLMTKVFGDSILNDLTSFITRDLSITAEEKTKFIADYENLLEVIKTVSKDEYLPAPDVIRYG